MLTVKMLTAIDEIVETRASVSMANDDNDLHTKRVKVNKAYRHLSEAIQEYLIERGGKDNT